MPWKKKHRERKSPRLKGWDYRTPAWYFITMVTKDRQHFFGEIRGGIMGLADLGLVAYKNWAAIPNHFDHTILAEFIVMPNHMHGLVGIMEWPVGNKPVRTSHGMSRQKNQPNAEFGNPKSGSLSTIINHYKSSVTRWARMNHNHAFGWQGRFHDHIVRNDREKERIQYYIRNNPQVWDEDQFFH